YDLHRDLTQPIHIRPGDGIEFTAFELGRAEAVRDLHNQCFASLGASEVSEEMWLGRLREETFRPEWSYLALDGDRVVGYAMSGLDESADDGVLGGWTERFGVHPEYRGRGLSLALLGRCLSAMRDAGCQEAGIGIDTMDGEGIHRLAAQLGYTTRDAVALLTKVVD
ncbi:MAG: GNAT family N-acetyltransferase, partial [Propionibacteriaceae bacterium]|nr:GNAT family N-acetyltransferase [Propionibacteriaceae bacterium]